jgi:HAD superfamily hydrolase (TIGR01509 family)
MKGVRSEQTLLFDLDGTLLDQRFDNIFWNETVPRVIASQQDSSLEECKDKVYAYYKKVYGTLDWYSSDFWSKTFNINIKSLTYQERGKISLHEGSRSLLDSLAQSGRKLFLVTNAHPDILSIKLDITGLSSYFQAIFSSHNIGHAKEDFLFWKKLISITGIEPKEAVLIDDNLAVLDQANIFGIGKCIAITQPDSSLIPIKVHNYISIQSVADLPLVLSN